MVGPLAAFAHRLGNRRCAWFAYRGPRAETSDASLRVAPGQRQPCLSAGEVGPALVQGRLIGLEVDLEEHVALAGLVPLGHFFGSDLRDADFRGAGVAPAGGRHTRPTPARPSST